MSQESSPRGRRLAPKVGRRGILAACALAAAAITERFANTGTAEAADGGTLLIARTNVASNQTTLARGGTIPGITFYALDQTGAQSFAIRGESDGGGTGVIGRTVSGNGIQGFAQNGVGAFLDSVSGTGFQGRSFSGVGVIGSTNDTQVLGQNQAPLGAFAARFQGGHGVVIDGDLQVSGQKSAVVKHKDGSMRRVYCMESPEAFFEDFGEGALSGGTADVDLDDDFASLVKTNRYHVFLTPYGESKGLYVSQRTAKGFQVKEQGAGKSNLRFAYRIVAPRGDTPEVRLQRSIIPELPKPPKPRIKEDDEIRERVKRGQ